MIALTFVFICGTAFGFCVAMSQIRNPNNPERPRQATPPRVARRTR